MPPRKRAASAPKDEPEANGDQAPAGNDAEQDDSGDKADAPERSDLQNADKPCTECMPNGWPEGAFSVGCIHGTYVRKQK